MKKFLMFLAGVFLSFPVAAVVSEDNEAALAFADLPIFDSVPFGIMFNENNEAFRGGSGTVVANSATAGTWLLVTNHQLYEDVAAFGFGSNSITSYLNGDYIFAGLVVEHSDPTLDLALVRLQELVPGIAAVPLYDGLYPEGANYTFGGWGDHGTLSQSGQTGVIGQTGLWDGFQRAAIGTDVRSGAVFGDYHLRYMEGDTGLVLAGIGAPGDSGGPVFAEENGSYSLAGVINSGRGFGAGTWTGYTFITPEITDWVHTTIDQNPMNPGAPIPEPGSLTIVLLGIAGLKFRSRYFS